MKKKMSFEKTINTIITNYNMICIGQLENIKTLNFLLLIIDCFSKLSFQYITEKYKNI